jgi:O-acetyl-ADP-ribose deacetylase (regulator of RNase III)
MKAKVNKVTVQVMQADILALSVKGIVNATDPNLSVPPRMAALAGPALVEACKQIGWCEIGSAVVTAAGDLPMDKVIHVVGPRWGEGAERGKLANATLACLRLAEQNRLRSLALPAISIGVLGYPVENCAKTMLTQIIDFTFEEIKHLRTIIVCLDTPSAYSIFKHELQEQIEELREAGEGEVQV